jgi:hypothetical protein
VKHPKIREGDLFAVPLREGGYALGVVARKNRSSILFGYFFGPRREAIPAIDDVGRLSPSEAVLVARFGYLGLRDGTWPILGSVNSWIREAWPIPEFCRTEVPGGRTWKVTYADNLAAPIHEERCSAEVAATLRPDSLAGAGAVEIQLTELLRS